MSSNGTFGKCPDFLVTNKAPAEDEADFRDAGIAVSSRPRIGADRAELIATLELLHRQAPRDVFIIGQLVRFMVDARRFDEAILTATQCRADAAWCAALRGYALASDSKLAAADSAFELTTRLTPAVSRCEWTDISAILFLEEREQYRRLNCVARDSLTREYWWLARPLLIDVSAPHARRVEHYRRKVMVILHASLPFDEMNDMRPSRGGDAVIEMLLRYGWPTLTSWSGDSVDTGHDNYLASRNVPSARPYTGPEYSYGRVRFGTKWSAVVDPFSADTLTWDLRPPFNKIENNMPNPNNLRTWWPVEHMRFSGGTVTQLPAGQTAFFRRPQFVRVLTALETGTALRGDTDETSRATLVASTGPDSVALVAESAVSSAGRVAFMGNISSRPVLMGIESRGTPSHPLTARTRFGVKPPQTLDSLPSGEIAISAPVFFAALSTDAQPRDLTALSQVMLGSTAVQQGSKVGLFWETYGASQSDSVRYTVQIKRMDAIGLLYRIGAILRVVDLPVTSTAISWQEIRREEVVQSGSNAASLSVSIAAGSILLDVASLSRGTYMIDVTAAVQGRAEARAGRVLTVR
ncbi:MAG: hypothetical protein ABJC26_02865 [Gemmatimonadaceae bacterium]